MSKKRLYVAIAVAICVIGSAVFAASQNFRPDVIFKGSSLTGWHKLGQADWRADNGEIIAAPKENGGWLMADKSQQEHPSYASSVFARRRKETSRPPLSAGPGMARMGGARFSGAEDLVPGFAKPAPTRAELLAAT